VTALVTTSLQDGTAGTGAHARAKTWVLAASSDLADNTLHENLFSKYALRFASPPGGRWRATACNLTPLPAQPRRAVANRCMVALPARQRADIASGPAVDNVRISLWRDIVQSGEEIWSALETPYGATLLRQFGRSLMTLRCRGTSTTNGSAAAQTASEALPRKESRRADHISSPLCTMSLHRLILTLSTAGPLAISARCLAGEPPYTYLRRPAGCAGSGVRLHAVARQRPQGVTRSAEHFEKRFS